MNRVHRTALAELDLALAGQTRPFKLELGLAAEVAQVQPLIDQGLIPPGILLPGADTFAVRWHEETLYVLGSTPRGLLHAVYALQESLLGGASLTDGFQLCGTFHFKARIFHARFHPWPGHRADVRYIAHLGATHCLVDHDWQDTRRSLQGYVTSPLFPDAVDPEEVAANRAGLRRLLDDCTDYGLGAMLWLTELPCQGGPWVPAGEREKFLSRYDPEVLSDSGTYEGKVLCFGHPRVQSYYRDLLSRFFAEFPEIETFFVFGLDSGGEFCDPQICPHCRGLSHFAQRDRLVCFLVEEGGKVRPNLRVLTTGWKWDRTTEDFLRHQARLPAASGVYLAAEKDGWQCERQSHDFLHAVRRICREQGQTFIGYDNFHWGDDTVHGLGDIQDFPLGIGAKIKRWHALEADGLFDHWGNSPEDIWCNSIACRDFFLNPQADPAVVARQIALRQFGAEAGAEVLRAWVALEQAHVELSPACIWSPGQWPGWYEGRRHWPLPGQFRDEGLRAHQAPTRQEGDLTYNPADFILALQTVSDAWARARPHYRAAVDALQTALSLATDAPVFYHFWWNGSEATPTCRDHIRRQLLHVESMAIVGEEIGLHFGLHALWETLGHDAAAFRSQGESLLRADSVACRAADHFFQRLGKPKDWARLYAAKAVAVENYLK
ncbi:MAG: hypothetical protein K9M98_09435 [Cephaloticoccus sp.]|nr:hypothetical protein [Cephaloticoccus sp.]